MCNMSRLYHSTHADAIHTLPAGRARAACSQPLTHLGHPTCRTLLQPPILTLSWLPVSIQADGHVDRAMSCNDQLVNIWATALEASVLGLSRQRHSLSAAPSGAASNPSAAELPVGRLQLMEVVDMLQDVARLRASALGPQHAGMWMCSTQVPLAMVATGSLLCYCMHLSAGKAPSWTCDCQTQHA